MGVVVVVTATTPNPFACGLSVPFVILNDGRAVTGGGGTDGASVVGDGAGIKVGVSVEGSFAADDRSPLLLNGKYKPRDKAMANATNATPPIKRSFVERHTIVSFVLSPSGLCQ